MYFITLYISGGDRLTDERAQCAKRAMDDRITSFSRQEGIIPKCEDFHREMNFHEVSSLKLPLNGLNELMST